MKIWVKPGAADRRVPWPTTGRARRYFPTEEAAAPAQVQLDQYIQRRLDQGDLVQTDENGKPLDKPATAAPVAPIDRLTAPARSAPAATPAGAPATTKAEG